MSESESKKGSKSNRNRNRNRRRRRKKFPNPIVAEEMIRKLPRSKRQARRIH